jgi:peptide/nickel transport system substrate-binding protein
VAGATTTSTLPPVKGGSVTIAQFAAGSGLDPTVSAGAGTAGAIELAAIYDELTRYDPATQEYTPRTAESLVHNADFTSWTLKLRPNITFTDGTAYDAAAAKASIERHRTADSRSAAKPTLDAFLESMTVTDPLTVVFKMKLGWAGFPYLLSRDVGMIVSPAALQKAGKDFAAVPSDAGAGPFKVDSYKPGEALVLRRNDRYWGGDVYLDELRFILVGKGDPSLTYEALRTNNVVAALLRDPGALAKARDDKFTLIDFPAPAGNIANMNSGIVITCAGGQPKVCTGKPDGEKVKTVTPTSDVRVRRAIAAAIDPSAINARVYEGKATVDSAPFTSTFPFYPGVAGPKYDLNEAKRLVLEAKAGGWDGKVRLMSSADPSGNAWGITVKTLLESAGVQVDLDTSKDVASVQRQVRVERDFDVVSYAYGLSYNADETFAQLYRNLYSTISVFGYGSPDMDAGLDALRVADTKDKRVAAYKQIAQTWLRDVPAAPIAEIPQAWVHSPKLHGVQATAAVTVFFDKAWIEH